MAATIHRGGAFAARLPAGYWYVATWDDPAWASTGYVNYPMAAGNDASLVRPFTPADVGTVLGF